MPTSSSPTLHRTQTVVIGAGQAGLAVSRCLTERGHEHVVLERGRIAERWRSERWDSLRLLTPNWMTRLPGHRYTGPDPDGYMAAGEVVRFFAGYAHSFTAPVVEHAEVRSVSKSDGRFLVGSSAGSFSAESVVVATGWCDQPFVPSAARHLAPSIDQVVPSDYRNPAQLADGGVLVVGASATGVQLAHELASAGRSVVLAVGSHQRVPRTYRGMDTFWWFDQLGLFDRTIDEVDDVAAARREPSPQFVGRPDRMTLDLTELQRVGVVVTGRLGAAAGHAVHFEPGLEATVAAADDRLARLLDRIDDAIEERGLGAEVLAPERPAPVRLTSPPHCMDLRRAGIATVVWATGYRRSYPWLRLPILDARGEIRQRRGVTPVPGVFVLGQRFQHHRNSSFIDGVGRDAAYVAEQIVARRTRAPLTPVSGGAPS